MVMVFDDCYMPYL
jgi:hypothetical protein